MLTGLMISPQKTPDILQNILDQRVSHFPGGEGRGGLQQCATSQLNNHYQETSLNVNHFTLYLGVRNLQLTRQMRKEKNPVTYSAAAQ